LLIVWHEASLEDALSIISIERRFATLENGQLLVPTQIPGNPRVLCSISFDPSGVWKGLSGFFADTFRQICEIRSFVFPDLDNRHSNGWIETVDIGDPKLSGPSELPRLYQYVGTPSGAMMPLPDQRVKVTCFASDLLPLVGTAGIGSVRIAQTKPPIQAIDDVAQDEAICAAGMGVLADFDDSTSNRARYQCGSKGSYETKHGAPPAQG
jgi:hypothetical protein